MAVFVDLRLAARQLRAVPGYTAATVATLALAIGASTAIFSAVYAVLLKPMPLHQPERLAVAWGTSASTAMRVIELSYLDIRDLAAATPAVGRVASMGSSPWNVVLDGQGEPVRLAATGVSGEFFDVVGARPFLGRLIRAEDDQPRSAPVVVLSHRTWTQRFGADPAIVGQKIQLDDQPAEVVGVVPAGFDYPRGSELWVPIVPVLAPIETSATSDPLRRIGLLFMLSRLHPGVTPEAAADEWSRAMATLQARSPGPTFGLTVTPFLDHQIGPARQAMWVLFGAVGVLLLIACANVSGLMLTRVSLRHQDAAVRMAIGGSRAAIARLWAAEAVWLTVAGGVLGLVASHWLVAAIVALAPEGIPRLTEVAIDLPVALFCLAVMALSTLLCAFAPIRQAGRVNLAAAINDGGRSMTCGRSTGVRSLLLVVQIGLAVVLLVAAGLVVRSFSALQRLDLGFDPGVLRVKVEPRGSAQPVNEWMRELLPVVAALGDVASAGAVYLTPLELGSIGQGTWVLADDQVQSQDTVSSNPMLNYLTATPDYFRAMRIPILRGRAFTTEDGATAPRVAMISQSTAAALFPGQNPIGRRLLTSAFSADRSRNTAWRTIVGVAGDVRYRGLHEVQLDFYDPAMQSTSPATSLVVRLAPGREGQALAVAAAVQARARQLDPRAIVTGAATLDTVVNREMAPWRFSAWVFALFAALAIGLASLGLISVVSLDVTNRQREFAIRLAVGASRRQILGGVLRSAGLRAGAGIVLGVAAAVVTTQSLRGLLVGVTLADGATYVTVVTLVGVVVAVAAYLPARRAAGAEPLTLLRRL